MGQADSHGMSESPSSTKRITRRRAMTQLIGGALLGSPSVSRIAQALAPQTKAVLAQPTTPSALIDLSAEDISFLDEMQRSACLYFVEQVSPTNGQVLDRAVNKTSTGNLDVRFTSSIAATGFGLTGLCIADSRGYMPAARIRSQVLRTLQFHLNKMPHERGFFYHFNDIKTGKPLLNTEVSSVDTAIFLCGVLTCRAHFNDPQITRLATQLYNRVDWPWMLNDGLTFSMGWHPESGFISYRWDQYSELMMLYLLAMGSPTNPISSDYWDHFTRPHIQFSNLDYISGHTPLFVHQYSHAWFDFANKRDDYADYFVNSIHATRAHKAFCLSLNRGYNDDYWGVSSSDWQHGYTAWGGPPLMGPIDGSVVPAATAGSLAFLPAECVRVLRSLKERYGKDAWGRYGLCDAFHPEQLWYDPDVLGIDIGIGLLMAENLRSGFVWKTFMQNPEPVAAMKLCGFRSTL